MAKFIAAATGAVRKVGRPVWKRMWITSQRGSDPHVTLPLCVPAVLKSWRVKDLTVVNIALPSAPRSLHFATVDRQWW